MIYNIYEVNFSMFSIFGVFSWNFLHFFGGHSENIGLLYCLVEKRNTRQPGKIRDIWQLWSEMKHLKDIKDVWRQFWQLAVTYRLSILNKVILFHGFLPLEDAHTDKLLGLVQTTDFFPSLDFYHRFLSFKIENFHQSQPNQTKWDKVLTPSPRHLKFHQ